MSGTHLMRVFEENSTTNFEKEVTVPETQPVKLLFQSKAFSVSAAAQFTGSGASFAFRDVYTRYALQRVCMEVIKAKNPTHPAELEITNEEDERLAWKFLTVCMREGGSTVTESIEKALVQCAIDLHYATARPKQFDMFVHLSASEMFFIDGDSLLMAAMSFRQVDWDLMQPVHVIFNAQLIIQRLQEQGARFHIIFFDNQKWFWEKAPQKLFIRECFRLSITNMAITNESLTVKTFSSYHCDEFDKYCRAMDPEFILLSDGEQLGGLNELQKLFHVHRDRNSEGNQYNKCDEYRSIVDDEAHGEAVSFYLRTFILWTTSRRIKVAYSSRIVPKENAMIVFAMTVDSYVFARARMLQAKTVEYARQLEKEVTLPALGAKGVEVTKNTVMSSPEKVVGSAVSTYLEQHPSLPEKTKQLCQAFVFSAYCTPLLSMQHRAQPVAACPEATELLNDIAPYLLQAFYAVGCKASKEVDLWDGHLLCAVAHHAKTVAPKDLLDADGVAELEDTWKAVVGDSAPSFLGAPLSELPEVDFNPLSKSIKYPYFSHGLVDHLSKTFSVTVKPDALPYPSGYGLANNLTGWAVAHPLDELDDVVDSQAETVMQRNMTDRDRKRKEKQDTAYVADAMAQAKSMDVQFAEPIAMVVSEDDEDTNDNDDGQNDDKNRKKTHEGQRNRKVRSKEDIIREETNLGDASRTVRDAYKQMQNVLSATSNYAKTPEDRKQQKLTIDALLNRWKKGQSFGNRFDPGFVVEEEKEHDVPIVTHTWRKIVEASEMSEVELVFTLDQTTKGKTATVTNSKQHLFGFQVIQTIVDHHITVKNKNKVEMKDNWGPFDRLRTAKGTPFSTPFEVTHYLLFILLKYIQIHFECRLMCRNIQIMLNNWKEERERARLSREEVNVEVGVPLFLYCHHKVLSIIRDTGVCLSETEVDCVRGALAHFDFPLDYYEKVDAAISKWQGRKTQALPFALRPRDKIQTESPEMLQLMHMGQFLERPIIPERDYRVIFNPDRWQRDLLDIVDQRGSAVVCAPTSAGKTFVSYYCMLNTLRTSNTRVVVYVAPTRALLNQAVADVCGRYGTKQYRTPGISAYGVHGGHDYHRFYDKCQVLIILPEVLETMLTSPKYKEWVKKLDYVILDEIHTMESSGNGEVWERVMALLPCPFVALSATLGETQQLCGWLNRVQARLQIQEEEDTEVKKRKRDYTVHDVPGDGPAIQRWNDIKKYIYLPPPGYVSTLKKLTATFKERHIKDLHPLSILTIDQMRDGFPPDITLVPSEVVQLYEQMLKHFQEEVMPEGSEWADLAIVNDISYRLNYLKPEVFFIRETYITQRMAREYEAEVKKLFVSWTVLGQKPMKHFRKDNKEDVLSDEKAVEFSAVMLQLCNNVLRFFSQHLFEEEVNLEKHAIEAATDREKQLQSAAASGEAAGVAQTNGAHFPDSKEFIVSNIINVLRELKARDMGPTIVFSFESEDCDDLVKNVVEQLEYAEQLYRETDEFANYKANMERKQAAQEAARRQKESNLKQKRGVDENGQKEDREVGDMDQEDQEDYTIPEVLPEFTFLGSGNAWEKQQEAIKACEASGESLLARAIKRGVGVHHAGVKGKLRRMNEILFRMRHSGVIFATETLALGVHSPCRSVVLAGDHILLDTTQFRQMMGRAGRRGLDFLGHLIFLSISMKKITRLMTSSMTVIKGNVQVTPITQLRLLQLYDFLSHRSTVEKLQKQTKLIEESKVYAGKLAERLFINPLFFRGREAVVGGNMEPFSVELFRMLLGFLQRQGLHFNDRPSSLGVLLVNAMYTFRSTGVGVEGFSFLSMLVRGVVESANFVEPLASQLNTSIYPPTPTQQSCSEGLAELLAYVFTVHKTTGMPLEIHRSALLDPVVRNLWSKKHAGQRQHRVVLAPLESCVNGKVSPIDNTSAFRVISAFYVYLASQLPSIDQLNVEGHQLPFMFTKKNYVFCKQDEDAVSMPIMDKLNETSQPFAARNPFVAVSGCGDNFTSVDDLVWTLRKGLLCDRLMLPLVDFTDGCRHDGAQVLVNACVADFLRCQAQVDSVRNNYRFTRLEDLNGLTQSESFAVLNRVECILSNLAGLFRHEPLPPMKVLEALFPGEEDEEEEEDGGEVSGDYYYAGAYRVLDLAERMHRLRSQIDKDYSGDQLRKARLEAKQDSNKK